MSSDLSQSWPTKIAAAEALLASGEAEGAARLLSSAILDPAAPDASLRLLASAYRLQKRPVEAIPALILLSQRKPDSAVVEHNLAAALGDCNRFRESEAAARRALAKGGQAPETWLVLGRALVSLGLIDEAETAFRAALTARHDFLPAHRDLAQLVWMRDGRVDALSDALAPLKRLAADQEEAALLLSTILRDTAGYEAAFQVLKPWLARPSVEIALAAAATASGFDARASLDYARTAASLAPGDLRTLSALGSALIACDRAREAVPVLERVLNADRGDQHARALLLSAFRITGDPRALTAADYQRLVRVFPLEESIDPNEWLTRLAEALRQIHPFQSHPFQQSIVNGAQSRVDPRAVKDPAVDRLFVALKTPIDRYVAETSPPWRGKPTGLSWRITGAWSVKLAAGGRHADHVHPRAWISSALYVETPPQVDAGGKEGWLRFGAVQIGSVFALPAEHWVRPQAGSLVLFPSFLWHGTEPFTGQGERLTIAFDLEPEQGA